MPDPRAATLGRPSTANHSQLVAAAECTAPALTRIMCIEHNAAIRRMIWLALVDIGRLEVCNCSNGEEAIALIGDDPPDMVLLDWQLPGLSGAETLTELRNVPGGLMAPVVIMASCCTASEAAGAGALHVVKKPFDPMQLASHLRRLYADTKSPRPS